MKVNTNWLFEKIDKIKNQDTGFVQFLKWCYSIGKISWIHSLIAAASGILIPIFFDRQKYYWMSLFCFIAIGDILFAYICNAYREQIFFERRFTAELLEGISSLLKSLTIFVENNSAWRNEIFKTTSGMVCEKLYSVFKEVIGCEIRISIEYTFQKGDPTKPPETYVKMAGRKSRHRSVTRKSVPLERKKKYYSYQIFVENNKGMNILGEDKIKDNKVWFRNPESSIEVKKYIGIAVSAFDDGIVNFILQIDMLDDYEFGKCNSEEDIKKFVDRYLLAYINIVTMSYLLNLNKKNELIEG